MCNTTSYLVNRTLSFSVEEEKGNAKKMGLLLKFHKDCEMALNIMLLVMSMILILMMVHRMQIWWPMYLLW